MYHVTVVFLMKLQELPSYTNTKC